MSNKVWNLPNVLTMIRLLLIPVTILLILDNQMVFALIVFLTACGTDLLDGYIARKNHLITKLGIWLDPLADKLMAVSVIVTFTIRGILPPFVMIVVFAKEFLMLLGGVIILGRGHVTPANKFGKIAALLLNISIGSGFLYEYLSPYYLYATYVALAAVIVAFVQYAAKNGHLIFEKKPSAREE
ncbi:CDP-alcohol phosphatidyltransferase family protein [Christensenellaceae bacterium NSJ-63]|uniref:CDP-diacylglycerol--glycerol-3-phosphate 3-phosphatidyltransferase n=1 Tax=Guopingia tenuis TaxID=2763656 RepID=A0A926HWY4_9FIRM|nr:CDP-alcohol phosphatidyltransferase family protein [Guopingia tenuis]MBC8538833.1 CDP-alcohol phosphatidyltransferase family protein [Guopingia tenuis]MBS5644667.1 CDP-alcohol phosphatidyltransferase family protein [Clostridiales bacterium]